MAARLLGERAPINYCELPLHLARAINASHLCVRATPQGLDLQPSKAYRAAAAADSIGQLLCLARLLRCSSFSQRLLELWWARGRRSQIANLLGAHERSGGAARRRRNAAAARGRYGHAQSPDGRWRRATPADVAQREWGAHANKCQMAWVHLQTICSPARSLIDSASEDDKRAATMQWSANWTLPAQRIRHINYHIAARRPLCPLPRERPREAKWTLWRAMQSNWQRLDGLCWR